MELCYPENHKVVGYISTVGAILPVVLVIFPFTKYVGSMVEIVLFLVANSCKNGIMPLLLVVLLYNYYSCYVVMQVIPVLFINDLVVTPLLPMNYLHCC